MENLVLVTGGTGFIGGFLVQALIGGGRRVRCLVRTTSDTRFLKSLNVELVYGDLLDKGSLKAAVKGVGVIYHLAAKVRPDKVISRRDRFKEPYYDVNVTGTKNLVEASWSEGVTTFICFSSIVAVGTGSHIDESTACRPVTVYGQSKLAAEEYVLKIFKSEGFPAIVVRPGQIYGPRCMGMLMLYRLIKHGLFMTIGNGSNKIPVCYVTDLVKGALLAEQKGRPGEIYFIGGHPCTFREFAQAISDSISGKFGRLYFPKALMDIAIALKEAGERVFNIKLCPFKMDISKGGIKSLCSDCFGSIDKAGRELGYVPDVNLQDGMRQAAAWYKDNHLI
ncbi:MAG: NAD-dependent epimerase/dehydratase family protein [Candidatus Omnitrophica bacterium]|nr:NAD-dependent epimerase/dehydratase family protein [Candidatus Omnitrophota bacterium]